MDGYIIAVYAALIAAVVCLPMAWASKHIWQNKRRTQLFAFFGILSAVVFMVLVYPLLPD